MIRSRPQIPQQERQQRVAEVQEQGRGKGLPKSLLLREGKVPFQVLSQLPGGALRPAGGECLSHKDAADEKERQQQQAEPEVLPRRGEPCSLPAIHAPHLHATICRGAAVYEKLAGKGAFYNIGQIRRFRKVIRELFLILSVMSKYYVKYIT